MKKKKNYLIKTMLKIIVGVWLVVGIYIGIQHLLTPKKNLNFKSVADYNNIELKEGTELKIEETRHSFAASAGSTYTFVYNQEYIGYIREEYNIIYAMSNSPIGKLRRVGLAIGSMSSEKEDIALADGEVYFYSRDFDHLEASDYYIYTNKETKQINLVKNQASDRNEEGKLVFAKNGLNFVKEGENYYFKDNATGEKVIALAVKEKKKKTIYTFKILSDKVNEYPTFYVIYFFRKMLDFI